jgi:hypothetical protein
MSQVEGPSGRRPGQGRQGSGSGTPATGSRSSDIPVDAAESGSVRSGVTGSSVTGSSSVRNSLMVEDDVAAEDGAFGAERPRLPEPVIAAGNESIAERYGRGRRTRSREKTVLAIFGGLIVVVFAAWVLWAGLDGNAPALEARDIGHKVVDEHQVQVTFEVTAEPGTPINCVAQALNEEFAPVGWKVLEIPASEQRTRQFTTDVLTTELGNTGLIYRCWLA